MTDELSKTSKTGLGFLNTSGTSSSQYNRSGTQSGTSRTTGTTTGTKTGTSSSIGTSTTEGTRTNQKSLDPMARGYYESLLGRFSDQFIGSPVTQAQGRISGAGGSGLQDLLEERARGILGGRRESDASRQYGADDISRRVASLASARGGHGAPAHAGVLARELGQYNRAWETDQFNRDIQGLGAAGQAAGQAQSLALDPMTRFASILQGFGALTQGSTERNQSVTREDIQKRFRELMSGRTTSDTTRTGETTERGLSSAAETGSRLFFENDREEAFSRR